MARPSEPLHHNEPIIAYTVRRFLHSIDTNLDPLHPFNELTKRTAKGPGKTLSTSIISPKYGRLIARGFVGRPNDLKEIFKEMVAPLPKELVGQIGRLALFGALKDNQSPSEPAEIRGKKYVGYLIKGQAYDALIEEQKLALRTFGLSGRNAEVPHLSVYTAISLTGAQKALQHYKNITPAEEITIKLGPPSILPLHKSP